MPIPSFKEQFKEALGPEMTIIDGYNNFDTTEDVNGLDCSKMNKQLEATCPTDRIEFIQPAAQEVDSALDFFLKSQKGAVA